MATFCAASLACSLAWGQQSAPAAVAPPPPELEKLEEGAPPAVSIKKPGDAQGTGNSVTERRDHGQTTEVKVQSGGSTYYLKPQQVGNALPGDGSRTPPTGAQWKVMDFDLGGAKPAKADDSDSPAK